MTNKNPYTKFTTWCLAECADLQRNLCITEYEICIMETPTQFDDPGTVFEIATKHPYKNATLRWGEHEFCTWKTNKPQIRKYLLHEMLHLVVLQLSYVASKRYCTVDEVHDSVEGLVEHLQNVLWIYLAK